MSSFNFYVVLFITAIGVTGCFMQAPTEPANRFFSDPRDLALAQALQRSDWTWADQVLRAGANVNVIGNEGMYPLIWTMYNKNKQAG